ncbi:MAG: hypothetical protein NTV05_14320 [Acidobacteria bacterium]|nr:hypothetical protein [Acidobacteriota bacterium]
MSRSIRNSCGVLFAAVMAAGLASPASAQLAPVTGTTTHEVAREDAYWIEAPSYSAAFDLTNDVYLVVYNTYWTPSQSQIMKGLWLDVNGNQVGTTFTIGPGFEPRVIYGAADNAFLLTYNTGNSRSAMFLRYAGTGAATKLTPTPLVLGPMTWSKLSYGEATYVPSTGLYLTTWRDAPGGLPSQAYLRSIKLDGTLGTTVVLNTRVGNGEAHDFPDVSCSPTECLAFGHYYNDAAQRFGNWGRWLDLTGTPTGDMFYFDIGGLHDDQQVEYSPTIGKYVLTWILDMGWQRGMLLSAGDTSGTVFATGSAKGRFTTMPYNSGTQTFVKVMGGWDWRSFAQQLDATGAPLGSDVQISNGPTSDGWTAAAANPKLGQFLAVYRHDVTNLRVLLLQSGLVQPSSGYLLSITQTGTGSGTVTSDSGGINCGTTCSATYANGTVVTLTATAASDSVFAGWSGTGCASGSVTITAPTTCSATFNLITQSSYTLAVAKAGAGTGTVTSNPGTINCGTTCSAVYAGGTQVTLTATPATGSRFGSWSGTGCAGGSVTVNANITCTATFNLIEPSTGALKPVGTGSQIIGETTGIDAFDVAFDSTMLQYLVVWSTWNQEVKGVLLNSAGQAAGSAFVIANGLAPRVAYSSASGTYLVTYTSGATRMARPVSPVAGGTATLGTPSTLGNLSWVSGNANAGSSAEVPSSNTFLTTWWDGASHVMIRSIGESGPVAAASTLITETAIPELPEIACGPSACLVVGRTWTNAIWARWVDLTGTATTARFDIESGGSSARSMARVAYNSTQTTWVVAWVRDDIPQTTTVAAGAVTAGTIQPVVPSGTGSQLDLAFNNGLDAFGIVAQGASSDIWAQGLDGAGTPFNGTVLTASTVPTTDGIPALTANPSAGQFLVVYRPTITTLRVQLLGEVASSGLAPFGAFDTPADGATGLQGSFAVTGWALDETGIARVEIWRDLVSGEPSSNAYTSDPTHPAYGKVFIANPLFVAGSRPDVEIAYSNYPNAARAGWGYLLLSWGLWGQVDSSSAITYKLYAYGYDVNGLNTLLGSKTITVDNAHATKPFGAIDTPGYGATVSGAFYGFGWALTPNRASSCSVANGSVLMGIDSGPAVPVTYLGARSDIAAAFPGFTDSSHAGGSVWIDTTTLSDGVHLIGWLVTDGCGGQDGIGSRFFTVSNGAGAARAALGAPAAAARRSAPAAVAVAAAAVSAEPPSVKISGGAWQPVVPAGDGPSVIEVRQGGAIELRLPSAGGGYTGHQDIRGERRHLPLGSSLDAETGVFSWQPGPGFLGNFDLVFLVQDREVSRVRVVVKPAIQGGLEAPDAVGAAVPGDRSPGAARSRPPKGPIKRD